MMFTRPSKGPRSLAIDRILRLFGALDRPCGLTSLRRSVTLPTSERDFSNRAAFMAKQRRPVTNDEAQPQASSARPRAPSRPMRLRAWNRPSPQPPACSVRPIGRSHCGAASGAPASRLPGAASLESVPCATEKELHERAPVLVSASARRRSAAAPQAIDERLYAATLAINGDRDQAIAHLRLVRDETRTTTAPSTCSPSRTPSAANMPGRRAPRAGHRPQPETALARRPGPEPLRTDDAVGGARRAVDSVPTAAGR